MYSLLLANHAIRNVRHVAEQEKIADELPRLEKIGVLEKVEFSDWASPIVPVLKPGGSVRICGDYKVTKNPVLDVPEHPMPTVDDLFTQLNGGEKYTKLDLSSAYQQVLLDEESRQFVTINMHLSCSDTPACPFCVASLICVNHLGILISMYVVAEYP